MKKHLLGLAIFSFIVVLFAVAFALLYVPKMPKSPQFEEVRQPVLETERKNRCNKKGVRFEVISTQFDFDTKKLTSQIRMKLDDYSNVPNRVKVSTSLYTEQQLDVKKFEIKDEQINDFQIRRDTNEAVFEVVSDLSKSRGLNSKENLYVKFEIYTTNYDKSLEFKGFSTEAKSVLFVHGKNSVVKK